MSTERRFRNVQEIIDLPLKPEAGDKPDRGVSAGGLSRLRLDARAGTHRSGPASPRGRCLRG
ncbi:hypothetical protein, partial [Thiocapsa sp. C2-2m]|uniref:hypothetical protein n=1 Tax=Thiocapsa sp. C2-2m TaxID=3137395 RepID=UPI0035ADCB0E